MELTMNSCCFACLDGEGDQGHPSCVNNPKVHSAYADGRLIGNTYDDGGWTAIVDISGNLDLMREARRAGAVSRVDYIRGRYALRASRRQGAS